MANKLKDCSPDDRAQAIIIAGNCMAFQELEELIKDGKMDQALVLTEQGIQNNFTCLANLAVKCNTNVSSSLGEALELLYSK